jgi:hypothetical protein
MRHTRHAGREQPKNIAEDGLSHAYYAGNWVLPEAFRSRVIRTPMIPQSEEFWKLFDWVCVFEL